MHGTVFSFTLAELHLPTGPRLVSQTAFNLCIERIPLLLVAVTLLALIVLAT